MFKNVVKVLLMAGVIAAFTTTTQASPAPEQGGPRASGHEAGGHGRACSNASVQGSFGFTAAGALLAPAPVRRPFR
jgi:hypothetical protein